jgi:16S rRNA (cytosine967-C5)-methyltransferase
MSISSKATDHGGLAAREAALALASAALDHRGGLDEAMERPPFSTLELRDRALARMIAMTLLRRMGAIDQRLAPRLRKAPPEAVTMLLRLGATQALYMDIPDFAAVDTTVRLAESQRSTRAFKGLINGILRGLLREHAPGQDEPERLAPAWLFSRWRAAYGEEAARAIAARIPEEAPTDLSVRDTADLEALATSLEGEILPGGSLRVGQRGDIAAWAGYAEGRWWVQDAAAAVPARLLRVKPGQTALDLCAAPGGKTLQLAAFGAVVTAVDRSAARLGRLRLALERTGLSAEVVVADAAQWPDERRFDAVLLDAPCTASGTFRRQPDVLWCTSPAEIPKLAAVQTRLLDTAAARVSPGGALVYCVCSLEPEEGEAQIAAFLKRNSGFVTSPIAPGEGGAPQGAVTAEGWLRILPHQLTGGLDGFFAARLARTPV